MRETEEKQRRAKEAREKADIEKAARAERKRALVDMNAHETQEGVMDSLMEALQTGSAFSRPDQRRKRQQRAAGGKSSLRSTRKIIALRHTSTTRRLKNYKETITKELDTFTLGVQGFVDTISLQNAINKKIKKYPHIKKNAIKRHKSANEPRKNFPRYSVNDTIFNVTSPNFINSLSKKNAIRTSLSCSDLPAIIDKEILGLIDSETADENENILNLKLDHLEDFLVLGLKNY